MQENQGGSAIGRRYMIGRNWTRLGEGWTRLRQCIGNILKSGGFWITIILSTLAICGYLSLTYWPFIHDNRDSFSSTIRNVSLIIGGVIAIELALWRSIVSERQVNIAQRGLLNERFQKGAEMLGSKDLSVRLGGIYALKYLATEHPNEYHVQAMELLCAFVRHPTEERNRGAGLNEQRQPPRADASAIAEIICNRDKSLIKLERSAKYRLDLSDADLRHINFTNADLSGAVLLGANLSYGSLMLANLSNAKLAGTIFSELRPPIEGAPDPYESDAIMSHAFLREANVSGAQFTYHGLHPAEGLWQKRLNQAYADPNDPPELDGVTDAKTGEPIVWNGLSAQSI